MIQVIPLRLEPKKGLNGFFTKEENAGKKEHLRIALRIVGHVAIPVLIITFATCYIIFGIIQVYSRD